MLQAILIAATMASSHLATIRSDVVGASLRFAPATGDVATVTVLGPCQPWVPAPDAPPGTFAVDGRDGCQSSIRWTAPYPGHLAAGAEVRLFTINQACPRVSRVEAHGSDMPPGPELPVAVEYQCFMGVKAGPWTAVKRLFQ